MIGKACVSTEQLCVKKSPQRLGLGTELTFSWTAWHALSSLQELYIHHLVDEAYTQARLSQRKAVFYKDIGELHRYISAKVIQL